jgi:hypothetical protein
VTLSTSVGLDDRDDAMLTGRGGDVLIGYERESDEPVVLRYEDRDTGVSVIGKSGTGKSSLLEHLVLSDLEHGIPGMVIDPHGRLAERIVRFAPAMGADNIVLLEVNEEHPFGLNLLDVDRSKQDHVTLAADSVLEAVKKLHGETDTFQPRLEYWLDLAVRAVMKNNGTLVDVPPLFLDKRFRETYLKNVTDSGILREFEDYDALRPGDQRNQTESVINRLARTCRSEVFKHILGSTKTTVPFDKVLSGRTMLIVSLPSETLSEEACNFLGSLLLCALKQRIMKRTVTKGEPPRLHLYLDEYQRFASRVTQDLLTQGRKYGAGITIAHQDLFSIKDPVVRNASRHAGTLILLGLIWPDAEELAGEFPFEVRPEWVEEIEEIDGTEPVRVFSPTPAEDIFPNRHGDPVVADAVKQFFTGLRPNPQTEYERNSRSFPTSYNVFFSPYASYANELLYEAMHGRLTGDLLFRFFVEYRFFLNFRNESPDYSPEVEMTWSEFRRELNKPIIGEVSHRLSKMERLSLEHRNRYGPSGPSEESRKQARNSKVTEVFHKEAQYWLETCLQPWLAVYCQHMDALRSGKYLKVFNNVDNELWQQAQIRGWEELTTWKVSINTKDPNNPSVILLDLGLNLYANGLRNLINIVSESQQKASANEDTKYIVNTQKTWKAIEKLRERMRLLLIIADGLQRQPVLVTTGEQKPRPTRRHIVHSGQTYADALNEFAAKLVTPPAKYVAQVKSPKGYFETQLRDALQGDGDWTQLLDVRERSQALYSVTTEEPDDAQAPAPQPASVPPRTPVAQRRATFPGAPPGLMQPDTEVTEELGMPQMPVPVSHPAAETGRQSESRDTEFPEEFIATIASGEQLLTSVEPHDAGALVIKPADVVIEAEVLFDEVVDATAAEVLVAPPAGLCLGNYLPAHVFSETMGGQSLEMLRTYVWTDQESFERAATWLHVGLAEGRAKNYEGEFLGQALVDLYHHDRATRAARDNGKLEPIHVDEIPQYRNRFTGRSYVQQLHRRGQELSRIGWKGRVPTAVTDAITQFIRITPDYDAIGQAEYRWRRSSVRAVVVYATFGRWAVEVCDWSP